MGVGLFGLLVLVVRALWVEVSTLWGPLGHPVGLWSFVTAGSILSLLVMALFVHHAFFAVDLVESARVSGPLFRPQ